MMNRPDYKDIIDTLSRAGKNIIHVAVYYQSERACRDLDLLHVMEEYVYTHKTEINEFIDKRDEMLNIADILIEKKRRIK